MSQEDKKFMKILEKGTKLENVHYQVPLPRSMCKPSKQQIPGKAKIVTFEEKWQIKGALHQVYERYNCKGLCQEINNRSSFWKSLVLTPSWCLPSKQTWKDKSCPGPIQDFNLGGNMNISRLWSITNIKTYYM